MRKKFLWLGLSFLLVVALVLAACGPAEEGEQEEEEEEAPPVGEQEEEEEEEAVTPAVGEPQYGGTLTYCYRCGVAGSADTTRIFWPGTSKVFVVLEHLIMGDLYKGPRGTNEHDFINEYPPPDEYATGWLAESWDVSPEAIVFHIREGVMWSGISPNPVMDGPREFTAYDAEYFLKYYMDGPVSSMEAAGFIDSIEATDRYTLVINTNKFDANWISTIVHGWGSGMMPKETIESAEPADFDNLVGTGPFVLREHRIGSFMVFDPNPLYWKGTIIDGKEWKIPFVDELYLPEIPDEATRVAAIRTGQVEMYLGFFDAVYAEELDKVEGLIRQRGYHSWYRWYALRNDRPPFDNKNVRRAVLIGTDRVALGERLMGRLDFHQFPAADLCTGIYTPIDEMPASTALLFTYDPVLAKQMLADEGYPDGLKLNLFYRGSGLMADIPAVIKDQWEDIGIELTLSSVDSVAYGAMVGTGEWGEADMMYLNSPPYHPMETLMTTYMPGGFQNLASYDNPWVTSEFARAMGTMDMTERRAILKDVVLQVIDDAPYLTAMQGYGDAYWWPWVKNYYGEISLGRCHAPIADIWLDLDLKDDMGY